MPETYEVQITAAQLQRGDIVVHCDSIPLLAIVAQTSPKRVKTLVQVRTGDDFRSYELRLEDVLVVERTRASKEDERERDLYLLRGWLWNLVETYEATKAKFTESFAIDPEYAISWLAESVVASKTAAEWAANVVHADGEGNDLVAVLRTSVKRLTSQVLSEAQRGGSRSSSTATNMCDACKVQAYAKILDDYRLQYIVSAY